MAIRYKLYQWASENSANYQKWYGKAVVNNLISTDQIAD